MIIHEADIFLFVRVPNDFLFYLSLIKALLVQEIPRHENGCSYTICTRVFCILNNYSTYDYTYLYDLFFPCLKHSMYYTFT